MSLGEVLASAIFGIRHMSREAAIIFGGYDPAKYGIYMPGLPKAGPPHIVPREPSA
jgi:hypothetical protein